MVNCITIYNGVWFMSCDISIVIPFIKQIEELNKTIDSIQRTKNELSHEIIVSLYVNEQENVDISKRYDRYENISIVKSGVKSASAMFNLGVARAAGKHIFFTDINNSFNDYWIDDLVKVLEEKGADVIMPGIKDSTCEKLGYGGTWNEKLDFVWLNEPMKNGLEIPFVPSYAFLIKADVFKEIGGFNEYLQAKGIEDNEFSLRLWLFGYKIIVNKNVIVSRRGKCINYFDTKLYDIVYNYIVLAYAHFSFSRFSKVIELLRTKTVFNNVAARLFDDGL